jgi:arylformamidase
MLQTDIFSSPRPNTSPVLQPLPEREKNYSPSSAIGGNYQPFIQAYIDRSKLAYEQVKCTKDLRYGTAERALMDYFPAPKKADGKAPGLLVFIHGGYWQELSKNESSYLAPAWHAAGFAHAVVGYTLAPQASLFEIVAQCRAAVAYLRNQAAQLGHDASNIVVAGSSAGGYLAAACASDEALALRGFVPISGVFDLRPLVGTSINDAVGLTLEEAAQLSMLTKDASRVSSVIAWGQIETDAFKKQSQALATHLHAQGQRCTELELPGRNHFDVVHELGDPQSALFAAVRKLFDRG